MKKVFFLVNSLSEFSFYDFIRQYLEGVSVCVGESLPQNLKDYTIIILWNYQKIIPNISYHKNIIIFHGSDLPDGKGWAPIYYTFSRGLTYYTLTGLQASDSVDTGNIIVKARFQIKNNYTAEMIRKWDSQISIMLVKEILSRFDGRELNGIKQTGEGSFYPRRKPNDNQIDLESKVGDIIGHLRGCEAKHPAFFYFHNTKYFIYIVPEQIPGFPDDLEITFFDPDDIK